MLLHEKQIKKRMNPPESDRKRVYFKNNDKIIGVY